MSTVDRVLAYLGTLVAVFVLAYVAGQVVSPPANEPAPVHDREMTP